MNEPDERPTTPDAQVPSAPKLPEVESPPPEAVLDGVPSTGEIVEDAQAADEIIQQQPGVDELLHRDR